MNNPVKMLRIVGLVEGASYLALLFFAMPLKYLAGQPEAVRIVGSLHGALFVLYGGVAIIAARHKSWGTAPLRKVFIASVLPFGPFVIDGWLKREEASSGTSTHSESGAS